MKVPLDADLVTFHRPAQIALADRRRHVIDVPIHAAHQAQAMPIAATAGEEPVQSPPHCLDAGFILLTPALQESSTWC
jgi:hypothetical protein